MPIDQEDLKDFGLPDGLINRVLAQFQQSIPEPPVEMKDYCFVGAYHAIGEFYAMKLLLAQGVHPAVSKVRALVGGTTKIVNDNIKTLRQELPRATFERLQSNAGDSAMDKLKQELIKVERAHLEIELCEADERHSEEIIKIEDAYTQEIEALKSRLDNAIGQNGKMDEMLRESQKKNEELYAQLKAAEVNKHALSKAMATAETLKTELNSKQESLDKLFNVNDSMSKAGAERVDGLNREITQLNSQRQKDLKSLCDLEAQLETYKKANADYAEERDILRSRASNLEHQLSQSQLRFDHEQDLNTLTQSIRNILEPVNMIAGLQKQSDNTQVEMSKATKAITDLSANILNFELMLKSK